MLDPSGLPDTVWLGGGQGAGKSSVARALTAARDLRLYAVDARTYAHLDRALGVEGYPLSRADALRSHDERWVGASASELADRFVGTARERLAMALDDLRALGPGPTVLVEGPQLFPALVAPLLPDPASGAWLLPAPDVGARHVAARGQPMLATDAEGAARNRAERDLLLVARQRVEAESAGVPVVEVDDTRSLDEVTAVVDRLLAARPGGLHGAATGKERSLIRRTENGVVLAQLQAWWADAGPEAMPEPPSFPWTCECTRLGCTAAVPLASTTYAEIDGPVTAPGHPS